MRHAVQVIIVLFCAASCTSGTLPTPSGLPPASTEPSYAEAQTFVTPTPPSLPSPPTEASQVDVQPSVTPTRPAITSSNEIKELGDNKHLIRNDSLFETLIKPFANEAQKRREDRAKKDPEYAKRVDKELNEGRVNFILYGYGETHEPPATERGIIGSITIISYNMRTEQADIISLTHDIRAPSIEVELQGERKRSYAQRIDQAYPVGGFRLMSRVLENATGLSADFQVAFKDIVIQRFIDNVFGGVEVDVPAAFDVHPFYLDGIKYPAAHFSEGRQKFDGKQVIQFIKTVPITQGYYGKPLEHNVRKHIIFLALLNSLSNRSAESQFWLKGSAFLTGELVTGAISYDFDTVSLAVNNIGSAVPQLGRFVSRRRSAGLGIPKINRTIYVADPANGDGGVQWVSANAAVNPITQRDIREGKYLSLDMTIPINANPYGDLITEYWPSVRSLVKKSILEIH